MGLTQSGLYSNGTSPEAFPDLPVSGGPLSRHPPPPDSQRWSLPPAHRPRCLHHTPAGLPPANLGSGSPGERPCPARAAGPRRRHPRRPLETPAEQVTARGSE